MHPSSTFIKILLVIITASFLFKPGPVYSSPRPGQPIPDFKVITTAGQSVTLDTYKGHVLVIDFFATWCEPCRQSIPHLVEMNRKYGKQGLHILGLSADEDGERVVNAFAREFRINYPVALAGDAVTGSFGIRSVPIMFVIDKKGKVAEIYRGFTVDTGRAMEHLTKRLLAEK